MVAHYWHSPANILHWIQWSVLALRCQVLWRRRSAEARAPAIKCSAVAIWSLLLMLSNDIKRLQLCKKKGIGQLQKCGKSPPHLCHSMPPRTKRACSGAQDRFIPQVCLCSAQHSFLFSGLDLAKLLTDLTANRLRWNIGSHKAISYNL